MWIENGRSAKSLASAALFAVLALCANGAMAAKRALTSLDAVQTARFMYNVDANDVSNSDSIISMSPDGRRFVLRIVRGNLKRNGVEIELVAGHLDAPDLDAASKLDTVARLFTTGLGSGTSNIGPHVDTSHFRNPIQWLDNENVAFLLSDDRGIRQVVRVNIRTKNVDYLTRHPTQVVEFGVGRNGVVLYSAEARDANLANASRMEGYVIRGGTDGTALFKGDLSGANLFDRAWSTEWFMQDPSGAAPRKIEVDGRNIEPDNRKHIKFSPDGRYALVNVVPRQMPDGWEKYTDELIRPWVTEARTNPKARMARNVQQLFVVDIEHGTARPLWDAPSIVFFGMGEWSPDGGSVLLAPTYLPPESSNSIGLRGGAVAIVDTATSRYRQLPIDLGGILGNNDGRRVHAVRWRTSDIVEIDTTERYRNEVISNAFEKTGAGWLALDKQDGSGGKRDLPIRFEVRQSLDIPPRLYAVDGANGQERIVLDPNPGLIDDFSLGRLERIEGVVDGGVAWTGLLIYPVNYMPGKRYPLVIQPQASAPISDDFTLYGFAKGGAGLGPAVVASYPGQVLANRNMAVLNIEVRQEGMSEALEGEANRLAFEAAANQVVESGLADRSRIGLVGFSRNGYQVEYTLTHTTFPFAAAIAADNWDPSYIQQTFTGYGVSADAVNGLPPFGEGLGRWLENAPGFNAEHVRTPLRKVEQSEGVLGVFLGWEIFARLRHLDKPVEYYVMPDAEHGAHNTQNPAQIVAVMQGTVDWFDFWLNGYEDPDPVKAEQYERWRRLRALHEADLKKPAPSRLKWEAKVIAK